ncbi:centromere protein X-like isoform X1 [Amblyomma americanum]
MAASSKAGTSRAQFDDGGVHLDENGEKGRRQSEQSTIVETPTFKTKTIQELMKMNFEHEKTRISADALKMLTELFRMMTVETIVRATEQAKIQCDTEVANEHLEKVLPQLMYDFP